MPAKQDYRTKGDILQASANEEPTIRDYFAAACIKGLLSHPTANRWEATHAARLAYQYADAMLAERAKPKAAAA